MSNIPKSDWVPGGSFDRTTPEGQKNAEAIKLYDQAVGQFVLMFAAIEGSLFALLGCLSGAPIEMAKVLFSGTRAHEAMDKIKSVMKARKLRKHSPEFEAEISSYLTPLLDQLGVINGMRNHLLHYGTQDAYAEEPTVSNWMRALDDEKLKEVKMPRSDLEKMSADLGAATVIIAFIGHRLTFPNMQPPEKAIRECSQPSWTYKSPLQGGTKEKSPSKSQKRKPPSQP